MSQNSKTTQATNIKLVVAVMGMGVSFIVDVYAMINFPKNYIVLGIVSVLFLVFTFLLIQSAIKLHNAKTARQEEVYNELFKSSKATYLMMRKSFGEMEDTVNNIGEIVKTPIEEFMDEQKNISQITVNRSKENADALMNSNDKLLDKFFEFETTLENFEEQMISKQKELMDSSVREITLKQQELSSVIKDTELEIKKEMLSMGRPMAAQPVAPVTEVPVMPQAEPEVMVEPEVAAEPIIDEPMMEEIPQIEEVASPVFEEEISLGFEEEEVSEAEISLGFEDEVQEAVAEEVPPMPDLSDPNKMMSADDIAALIANMGGGTPTEPEPEPEPVEEVEEEKPPMPDLSDPNKMMSPEDIAALLANL